MIRWTIREIVLGAAVGCILMAVAGGFLGGLMGALVSMTSLGSPATVRNEAIKLSGCGAVAGVIIGAAVGGAFAILGGSARGSVVGATVGACVLALGGGALGSVTVNNSPVNLTRLAVLTFAGAVTGVIAGAILGRLISPVVEHLLRVSNKFH